MTNNNPIILRRPGLRFKVGAYGLLLAETFKSSALEYFTIRSRAVMKILGIAMEAAVFGFIGIAMSGLVDLDQYGVSSGSQFVLSGVIIGKLVGLGQIIQTYFFRGNYKSYHNTPFNTYFMSFVKSFNIHYFFKIVELIVYLTIARVFFGLKLNILSPAFLLVIGLGVIFQLGLNLFASGWQVITKHGNDPVNWFYNSTRRLFSGELFPTTLLPSFLIFASRAHPQTYVNRLSRGIGIPPHEPLTNLASDLLTLAILSTAFLALGCLTLRYGIADAKRKGTLKW